MLLPMLWFIFQIIHVKGKYLCFLGVFFVFFYLFIYFFIFFFFCLLSYKWKTLKEKTLPPSVHSKRKEFPPPWEQIISFKSRPHFQNGLVQENKQEVVKVVFLVTKGEKLPRICSRHKTSKKSWHISGSPTVYNCENIMSIFNSIVSLHASCVSIII